MNTSKMFNGLPTLIGSLPVSDYDDAINLILDYTAEIPLWPQLPSNPLERMLNQFIEGLPGIIETEKRTYFDLSADNFDQQQLEFYEEYIAVSENPAMLLDSRFKVSKERAHGIYDLKKTLSTKTSLAGVKGQITGPFTLLTGLSDQDHRLGYYDPIFREMVVKNLAMKAAWQVYFLKDLQAPTLIFIDEPALASLGSSAFISISKDDIDQDLSEVIKAIQQADGLAGIHVCANTDWNFVLSLNLDILSFDAHGYFDRLITCKEQLYSFFDRGGTLAWGIIPTADEKIIMAQTCESLVALWEKQAAMLENDTRNKADLLSKTLITPSCGTGALSKKAALKVLTLTRDVSAELRRKYLS